MGGQTSGTDRLNMLFNKVVVKLDRISYVWFWTSETVIEDESHLSFKFTVKITSLVL
jgi:hypothetical protein